MNHQFDFCDRDRHFGTSVVQASATCQTLLNAIFAVSAKHLSLRGEFDPLASDRYQRKCLQILIPALNDQYAILESTLFAATAILRLFDEMTGAIHHHSSPPVLAKLSSDRQTPTPRAPRAGTSSAHTSFCAPGKRPHPPHPCAPPLSS